MAKRNDGGPAFPRPRVLDKQNRIDDNGCDGMSLRDHFAGQALAGPMLPEIIKFLSDQDPDGFGSVSALKGLRMVAYVIADAMLEEREQE